MPPSPDSLKGQVRNFWNEQSCDTQVAQAEKFSRAYFDQIETFRYFDQAFIHAFAQFSRYHGQRVLEVGFGAGTDFIQWVRSGARVSGIDLTDEALANVRKRLEVYALPVPEHLSVGDAENLSFESGTFDLGYSFGVLHHSPNTEKAVAELVRVVKPGGEFKIMLYNRHSIAVANVWVKQALLKGRPWKNFRWALWNHVESVGTKGYTRGELAQWLPGLGLNSIHIQTFVTSADALSASFFPPLNWFYRGAIRLAGSRYPWRAGDYVERVNAPDKRWINDSSKRQPNEVLFSGNPLGFFHCISARKN